MRVVFIGRHNFANHFFAEWLSQRHEVVAFFRADARRYTIRYRMRWVKRRLGRNGLLRTIDQVLYSLYFTLWQKRTDERLMRQAFTTAFGHEPVGAPCVPVHQFVDLNSGEALKTLADLKPDLVFAACISQYLARGYQKIPRYGTVLYHEGLTPEYKGVHTAFWANLRGEPDRIGYTLLQLNDGIDAGKPLAQGLGEIDPKWAHFSGYAGHKALIDGLPDVERALAALEAGQGVAINRKTGRAHMFTYPGLSDEVRRLRRRRKRKVSSRHR